MKKKIFFAFLIINIFFFSLDLRASEIRKALIVDPKTNRKVLVAADEFVVKFRPEVEEEKIDKINKKFGVEVKKKLGIRNIYCLKVPPSKSINEMVEEYRKEPDVEFVEPNYIRRAFLEPNDPGRISQWGIYKIQAPEAWDTETGNESIVIAILDTGVDYDHEDLKDNMWDDSGRCGYDFVNEDNDPDDDNSSSHGTTCAGIAAAVTNNGIGIAGVSWKSKIMAVKVLNANGEGTVIDEVEGIDYAASKNADIISMSFGTKEYPPIPSDLERNAINDAYSKGCFIVAASGNDNKPYVAYPAAYDNVVAIGASNDEDKRCSYPSWGSNYGQELDVVAPGNSIYTTLRNNLYGLSAGTSMATPFVAGEAALILSHLPGLAPSDVKLIIERTSDGIGSPGWDEETGCGRINAYSGLTAYYVAGNIVHLTMNYPNPFKPREKNYTTIYFTTARAVADKSIRIYNLAGEMVLSVEGSSIYMDKWYDDGYVYKYNWDGRNISGETVASGIYIYVVNADGNTKKGRLALIK